MPILAAIEIKEIVVFEPGDLVDNRFRIDEEIGRGGMGIVLRVGDIENGQEVSLKCCPESDTYELWRFAREITSNTQE